MQNSPIGAVRARRFYNAAVALNSDKVTPPGLAWPGGNTHRFDVIYDKYLGHIPEDTPLRILEIGLGCDMPAAQGVGNSLKVRQSLRWQMPPFASASGPGWPGCNEGLKKCRSGSTSRC